MGQQNIAVLSMAIESILDIHILNRHYETFIKTNHRRVRKGI
jgi:hypothetical protein